MQDTQETQPRPAYFFDLLRMQRMVALLEKSAEDAPQGTIMRRIEAVVAFRGAILALQGVHFHGMDATVQTMIEDLKGVCEAFDVLHEDA